MRKLIAIAALAFSLTGCAGVAQVVAETATHMSTALPSQVNTLDDAIKVDTLAMQAVHATVDVHKFKRAQLVQIDQLNDSLHAALVKLEEAHLRGESLVFATFNEALRAFNAYRTQAGM